MLWDATRLFGESFPEMELAQITFVLIKRSKCNATFCYICAAVWKTCACPPNQKQGYRNSQDEQRVTKDIRKAEGQGRHLDEQEREIQEKWLKMVEAKYGRLTREMDSLHQRQWYMLGERHRHERDEYESERVLHERQRAERLVTDIGLLDERRIRKIENHKILLQREREALRSGQATEEDEYWFSLQSYLKGRPNKEERQKTLMEKFSESQVEQMNVLHQQQQTKLAELNMQLEAEQTGLESAAERACEAEKQIRTTNIKNRTRDQYGDTKWFEVIRTMRHNKLVMLEEEAKADESEKIKFILALSRKPVQVAGGT